MTRRLFLTALTLAPLTEKRDLRKIVTEISRRDLRYNEVQQRIVARAKYFTPESDAAIKGWAREESKLSHEVGDLWQEFAEIGG